MPWIYLFCAGLLEIGWAYSMKRSEGFSLLVPSLITLAMMVASFGLLALAMKSLPLGTAYAVWTGIGAVGAFVLGILLFKEPAQLMRFVFVGVIIVGIIGLKMSSDH
jgi:quaternary ammonium compound-resistance protein SugE